MVRRAQAAGDTAGQHALPPIPWSTPETGGPGTSSVSSPTGRAGGRRAAMRQPERKGPVKVRDRKLRKPHLRGGAYAGPLSSCSSFPLQPQPARDHRGGQREDRPAWQFESWTQGCQTTQRPVALAEGAEATGTDPDPRAGFRVGTMAQPCPPHHLEPALPLCGGALPWAPVRPSTHITQATTALGTEAPGRPLC